LAIQDLRLRARRSVVCESVNQP